MSAAGLKSKLEPDVIKGTQPNRQLGREAGIGKEEGKLESVRMHWNPVCLSPF